MPARAFPKALAVLLAAVLLPVGRAQADSYQFTDLRPYGYSANAINNNGDVVGDATYAQGASIYQQGFILHNGARTLLGYLAPITVPYYSGTPYTGDYSDSTYCQCPPLSHAADVNDAGVVAGWSSVALPGRYGSGTDAATWKPIDPGVPSSAAIDRGAYSFGAFSDDRDCNSRAGPGHAIVLSCYAKATAINAGGDIAGYGETYVSGGAHGWVSFPFLLPAAKATLSTVGATDGPTVDMLAWDTFGGFRAAGLNATGHSVVTPDPATRADANSAAIMPGGTHVPFSPAYDAGHLLNDAGWVAGVDSVSHHGRLLKNGTPIDLPPLALDTYSSAAAVNTVGDVVGTSGGNGNCTRAVEWKHTDYAHPIDLNSLVPSSGWQLYSATSINDKGQVIGGGTATTACPGSYVAQPWEITPGLRVSVSDADVVEPSGGATANATFTVSLSSSASQTTTVDYATVDGTGATGAVAGTDYTDTHGTLTFDAGQTSKTIDVPVQDVGVEPDKHFAMDLSNPVAVDIDDGHGVATIHGRTPLNVSIAVTPHDVVVPQTADGPTATNATVTVTLTNNAKTTLDHATLPDKLTLGWHGTPPPNVLTLPIAQVAAPATLDLGSLAPGGSRSGDYTAQLTGDGRLDIEALATAAAGDSTVKGLGSTEFDPDTQLLVDVNKLGAVVHSQANPQLIQAGTSFLVKVHLENRSSYRRIIVDPIYPALSGNAADGHVQDAAVGDTSAKPSGDLSEVQPAPYVLLQPGQGKDFLAVVRTAASDAFADRDGGGGGTRAGVKFALPKVHLLDDNDNPSDVAADHVVLTPGSDDFQIGIDDSGPQPPPFSYLDATWSVGKGLVFGLWRATWGTVRGILWDLPKAVVSGVYQLSTATLNEIDRVVELWTSIENDPVAQAQLFNAVADKILATYDNAPQLLTQSAADLHAAVSNALTTHFGKLAKDWYAGDWKSALTEMTAEGTDGAVNLALMLGPAVIARVPKVAQAWEASRAALYSKVTKGLEGTVRTVEEARHALSALRGIVKPGFWFTDRVMSKLFGVAAKESTWLKEFAKAEKISVVFRTRAAESLNWLKKGAELKPYWIKTKNVSWADVKWLGYHQGDVGRIVMRKPPLFADVEDKLLAAGVKKGSAEYVAVQERWQARVKEFHGELKSMESWNEHGKVRGKWPWQENGVDPRVQADEFSNYRFRLVDKKTGRKIRPGDKLGHGEEWVPEIFNPITDPHAGNWRSITGDIDLIAITNADGTALSDARHVAILKKLRAGPLGTQHPESATWVKDGKFWFKAKEGYLTNDGVCCMAQYGPDGRVRAVEFDHVLSAPEQWTKDAYRIFWKGGYQVGPGQ